MRMIPKSGYRFPEKIVRPDKIRDCVRNSISAPNRQALGVEDYQAQYLGFVWAAAKPHSLSTWLEVAAKLRHAAGFAEAVMASRAWKSWRAYSTPDLARVRYRSQRRHRPE
jgi:hypothetical protein